MPTPPYDDDDDDDTFVRCQKYISTKCTSIVGFTLSIHTPLGGLRVLAAFTSFCSEFFLLRGKPGAGSSPLEVNVDGEKTRVSTDWLLW